VLTVVRDGKTQLDFTIVRDTIHVPSVESKILEGNIGYLQVSQFSDDTDELAQKAAQTFRDAGVQKVVLDLRDNPGGEVNAAVGLCSLWLDNGQVVVEQKRGSTTIDTSRATATTPLLRGMQTVVLVNAGSASASEITALALRDQVGARLIGEKTYGKGVVQQLISFRDGSTLKVTIAKWYSPKGTNIDQKGITPDQEVKPSDDDIKNKNDVQLQAAQEYLSK
jgi:carboxyl-terminal processing protease